MSEEGHSGRGRRWALAGMCLLLFALVPSTASAGTAQVSDGRLLYTAGEDEPNVLVLSAVPTAAGFRFTLSEHRNVILRAGRGCVTIGNRRVRCDAMTYALFAGDSGDNVRIGGIPRRVLLGRIDAGPGGDFVVSGRSPVDARGGPGNDILVSTPTLPDGTGGALRGGSGRDLLVGRTGPPPNPDLQQLFGGPGNDRLIGGEELFGGSGNDRLSGARGADRLRGEAGDDNLDGGSGRDRFSGGRGLDVINSQAADRGGLSEPLFCGSGLDLVTTNLVDRLARDCNLVTEPEERITAHPRLRGRVARFRLRCKRSSRCRGTLRLRRPGRRRAFARRRYSISAGAAKNVRLRLNRRARRLIRRGGLRARVTTAETAYTIILKR